MRDESYAKLCWGATTSCIGKECLGPLGPMGPKLQGTGTASIGQLGAPFPAGRALTRVRRFVASTWPVGSMTFALGLRGLSDDVSTTRCKTVQNKFGCLRIPSSLWPKQLEEIWSILPLIHLNPQRSGFLWCPRSKRCFSQLVSFVCEETPCQRIAEISQGVGTVSGVRRSANHALPQMEMDRAGQGWTGLERILCSLPFAAWLRWDWCLSHDLRAAEKRFQGPKGQCSLLNHFFGSSHSSFRILSERKRLWRLWSQSMSVNTRTLLGWSDWLADMRSLLHYPHTSEFYRILVC